METPKANGSAMVDLGKELTCSICTEILYQPLTLLDCLHTFCGSCLKSWFSWQASNPVDGGRPQFTCPSCRASVRDTRHDAKVATLLDLFLQSNPDQAKSAEEKEEIASEYKHGDSVLPEVGPVVRSASDDEDERILAEVRDMSLREVQGSGGSSRRRQRSPLAPHSRGRSERSPGAQAREQRVEDARRRRRAERRMNASPAMRNPRDMSPDSRRVEHQSSLRSLIGSTGESGIEDEILRQIAEEGLLDGIDLHSLTPTQEDELTERIAQAFRRRHRVPSPPRSIRQRESESPAQQRPVSQDRQQQPQQQQQERSLSASGSTPRAREPTRRAPPTSRPRLLEPATANRGANHRRSASDQGTGTRRRRTSPTPPTGFSLSSEALAQPAVSTTGSGSTTGSSTRTGAGSVPGPGATGTGPSRRRASNSSLPPTSLRHQTIPPLQVSRPRRPSSPGERQRRPSPAAVNLNRGNTASEPAAPATQSPSAVGGIPALRTSNRPQASQSQPSTPATTTGTANTPATVSPPPGPTRRVSNPVTLPSTLPPAQPQMPPEPSISCERCGKSNIQYELHKVCKLCKPGNYCLCVRCYRLGRGCLHWFGFGHAAQYFFEKKMASLNKPLSEQEPPHKLTWRRYLRLSEEREQLSPSSQSPRPAPLPLSRRVQIGMFCDMCEQFSDECFWKCRECNDGEWGFCNNCVNQDKCCTHPLLPISRVKLRPKSDAQTPPRTTASPPPSTDATEYRPLTFSTQCNVCTYPIPPSTTRFHCIQCNEGDYDMCTNCYLKLGASGKISKDNGRNGWRRCLQGHRMIIVGFEDHRVGQMRVVVQGLVGGHAWKDEHIPTPSSGSKRDHNNSNNTPTSPVSETNGTPSRNALQRQDSGRWTWTEPSDSSDSNFRQRRRLNRARQHLSSGPESPSDSSSSSPFPLTTARFPPSGGIGLRLIAKWSHHPEPDNNDEIMFPRGAEITEAENINDDWLWGCYAGQKGFLPGGYVLLIDEVGADGIR
ncbi:RING finger domain-containing protein [Nannizzia gypsea CBS 118893]|uniref:RING finger domain-containing protein n=1 Tax=Arthroderma gypseum (strain ATCC MYA-4604 / CBS 118893) TaxID=535722 RepID=E4UMK5_ARTGP|nr:RING finger domain-containing protein [Nannizzia gypsea CBS 118893]EFQ99422.1 RING finger domain-containing protein [Nannizzia gypsea CBS 118893]